MARKLPGLKRRPTSASPSTVPSPPASEPVAEEPQPGVTTSEEVVLTARSVPPLPSGAGLPTPAGEPDGLNPTPYEEPDLRLAAAQALIQRHTRLAAAGGALPLPGVDVFVVGGVQLELLSALSQLYEVPFSRERARVVLLALLGSLWPYGIGAGIGGLLIKSLPVVGTLAGLASVSVLSGGATRVLGEMFLEHLQRGGDIRDFDEEGSYPPK